MIALYTLRTRRQSLSASRRAMYAIARARAAGGAPIVDNDIG